MATDTKKTKGYSLEGWPQKDYNGPQPWDHDALNIPREEREKIGSGRNTVTPVVTHRVPILTSGSTHEAVHELGRKLGELGFPNSVSRGENPFGHVDQSVITAVGAFRNQYGIEPDPGPWGGNTPQGRQLAEAHIDPWTVEGILRAHKAEIEDE